MVSAMESHVDGTDDDDAARSDARLADAVGNGGGGADEDEEEEDLDPSRCETIVLEEGDGIDDADDMDDERSGGGGEEYTGGGEIVDSGAEEESEEVVVDDTTIDLLGHTGPVFCVHASPTDVNVVASGGGDDRGLLFDVRNNQVTAEVKNLGDSVGAVAFSSDGTRVAYGVLNGQVIVVDVASGKVLYEPEGPGESVEWLRWHPKGPFLLAGSEDNMLWMWNERGEVSMCFAGHGGSVTCGGFTPDGRKVLSGSEDGTVRVWNPRDGVCLAKSEPADLQDPPAVLSLDMSMSTGTSTIAVIGYSNGAVRIINAETAALLSTLPPHASSVESVMFSPPTTIPRMCASAGMDGTLRVWDMDQSQTRCEFKHDDGIVACLWHPRESGMLISASADRTVRAWDTKSVTALAVFQGNRSAILGLTLGASGEYVATAGDDHTVRIFSLYQQ